MQREFSEKGLTRAAGDYVIHLRHDPTASATFPETHVRRLEAIRRVTKGVEREPDGTWIISPDHLERAAAYERRQAKEAPVVVQDAIRHTDRAAAWRGRCHLARPGAGRGRTRAAPATAASVGKYAMPSRAAGNG